MIKIGSLLLLLAQLLFPFAIASVEKAKIIRGESVSFTITVQGQNPQFPNISAIGGYRVEQASTSKQNFFVNGKHSAKVTKTFKFTPTQDVLIPAYEVRQNNKISKTQEIKISVVKNKNDISNGNFIVEVKLDKNELYEFEHTILKITFKRNSATHVSDLKLTMPTLDSFWTKQVGREKAYKKGDEVHYEINYLISPQKSGKFIIPPVTIDVGKDVRVRDNFFGVMRNHTQYKKYFSSEVTLSVRPLPDNISLVGDFKIKAFVDKSEANSNEPVNLTIQIDGNGNFEDLVAFDIKIPSVSVYANEPIKSSDLNRGSFTQKLALIAGMDYTIPPITLSFFSPKDKTVKTVKTKMMKIKIHPLENISQSIVSLTPIKEKNTNKPSSSQALTSNQALNYTYAFASGFVLAFIIAILLFTDKGWFLKYCPCVRVFKMLSSRVAFNDKEALNILLSSSNQNRETKEFIEQLEKKLYKKEDIKIDYKRLRNIIKNIQENNVFKGK